MKKILFLVSLCFVFISPVFSDTTFYDLARDVYEQEGVLSSEKREEDVFRVNRAEFYKLVLSNIGFVPSEKILFTPTPFKDTPPRSWFAPYVQKAYRLGLIPQGEFAYPDRPLTRIDAFSQILEAEGYAVPKIFPQKMYEYRDLLSDEERRIASRILNLGVVAPINNTVFGAKNFLQKKELIEILYRFRLVHDTNEQFEEVFFPNVNITVETQKSSFPKIEFLESVREELLKRYYKPERIDENKMVDGAIKGYVESLGDPYSSYFPARESQSFMEEMEGDYEGIGAYLEVIEGQVVIQTPMKGSPAEEAGVKAGDIILAVDGKEIAGMNTSDVASLIKGPKGTTVSILFLRDGKEIPLSITRGRIQLHAVYAEVRDTVLIITISQFNTDAMWEFSDAISNHFDENITGIILDVRSNPGGFLNVVENILSYFVEKGKPLVFLEFKDSEDPHYAKNNQKLVGVKTAVLQNKASASASEILSGTLKDYGIAKIFGETSFGKGTVQEIIQYQNGASLKVTVAQWLTAHKNPIDKKGVVPDVFIENDIKTETDEVLEKALRWIRYNEE